MDVPAKARPMTVHRTTPARARTWGNSFADHPERGRTNRRCACPTPSLRTERARFARTAKGPVARSAVQARTDFRYRGSFRVAARSKTFLALRHSPRLIFDRIFPDAAAIPRAPNRAPVRFFPPTNRESSWDAHLLRRFEFWRLNAAIDQQAVHAV